MTATHEGMTIENGVLLKVTNEFVQSQKGYVEIPDSVTEIGDNAFCFCFSLQSVTIPNSVTKIGGGAFFCCTGLQSVTIPDSVTGIGGGAFYNCTNLQSVTMPHGLQYVFHTRNVFEKCPKLLSVKTNKQDTADSMLDFALKHPALIAGAVGAIVCAVVIITIASMGIGGVGIIAGAGAIAAGVGANVGLSAAASAIIATAATGVTAGLVSSGLTFFGLKMAGKSDDERPRVHLENSSSNEPFNAPSDETNYHGVSYSMDF